jgi:hypothetical protein
MGARATQLAEMLRPRVPMLISSISFYYIEQTRRYFRVARLNEAAWRRTLRVRRTEQWVPGG